MSDLSTRPPEQRPKRGMDYWSQTPPWYVFAVMFVLAAILVVVLLLLIQDDDNQVQTVAPSLTSIAPPTLSATTDPDGSSSSVSTTSVPDDSTTSQTSTTQTSSSQATTQTSTTQTSSSQVTTTTATSSSTVTTIDPQQYLTAVWPDPASTVRYEEPVAAARGFAEDYLDFQNPILGPFLQGDGRSGEVEFRPTETGPVTTVFVRQLDASGSWWILGSVTENILVDDPDGLEEIDSPLVVKGSALAFEGVVDVELLADGSNTPLIEGSVTGGGTSREPFEGSFEWTNPGEGAGALILKTTSMDDGRPWEAVVIRVIFATE